MLTKLFGSRKRKPPFGSLVPLNPVHPRIPAEEKSSYALKIIHAGGTTEYHYMAVPAARIMAKYPSFILARPEIFRRPWDSVVQPDEILVPGQKFFVVPLHTVKQLRQRIRKPIKDNFANSLVSASSISYLSAKQQDELTSKAFLLKGDVSKSIIRTLKSKGKNKSRNHHVSFVGVDSKPDSNSVSMEKKSSKGESGSGERKRRVRNTVTWEPSLTVIAETNGSDELMKERTENEVHFARP